MANKNIVLHPITNGIQDNSINLYPQTTANNVVDLLDIAQDKLVSGTNIKTIDGQSVLGSGDIPIRENRAFPSSWPTTNATSTKAFCDVVNADSTAIQGKSYLGEVYWSDLPSSLVNCEVVVEIMAGTGTSNKVIHLTISSGNVNPYRWEYTYWNNGSNVSGWIAFSIVVANPVLSGSEETLLGLEINGVKYKINSGSGRSVNPNAMLFNYELQEVQE